VLKAADFAEAKRLGKFALVFDSQDASILGTPVYGNNNSNIEELRALYGKGLRILQLTYTTNNGLGSGYDDIQDYGLSRLGRAVVEEMNRLGMLIDISHCSENTTLDAIERSARPIAATHAGCYSLFPYKRNKSDKVIRALGNKGGYLGIYNMTMWMTDKPVSSVETIVDHIHYAVNTGGIDLVGFGSDHQVLGDSRDQSEKIALISPFINQSPGLAAHKTPLRHVTALDMDGPDRMLVLANALSRRSYKGDAIEKILGGNFVRVFRAACG
jgi:membrane dipeptidase